MARAVLALLALVVFVAAVPAGAGCIRSGSQLRCTVGGADVWIGTRIPAVPPGRGRLGLRDLPLDTSSEDGWRIELQSFAREPLACHVWGNERYCY